MRPPRRRSLSAEERRLWAAVAQHVAPMPGRVLPTVEVDPPPADPPAAPLGPVFSRSALREAPTPPPKPLVPLDRKTARGLARGTRSVDGALDLHGMTQAEAHGALLRFVARAQNAGHGVVLVVTGKGPAEAASGDGNRGVLRRLVPLWLSAPALRATVLGFEEAAPRRGGSGALYVRLRRRRAGP